MPHNAAFHQGLHCLLSQNRSSKKYNIFLKLLPVPLNRPIYTLDHPIFLYPSRRNNSLGYKGLMHPEWSSCPYECINVWTCTREFSTDLGIVDQQVHPCSLSRALATDIHTINNESFLWKLIHILKTRCMPIKTCTCN